jgi:hypothetical protein
MSFLTFPGMRRQSRYAAGDRVVKDGWKENSLLLFVFDFALAVAGGRLAGWF